METNSIFKYLLKYLDLMKNYHLMSNVYCCHNVRYCALHSVQAKLCTKNLFEGSLALKKVTEAILGAHNQNFNDLEHYSGMFIETWS